MTLQAAKRLYLSQRRLIAVGAKAARRTWEIGDLTILVPTVELLQLRAARDGSAAVEQMVTEQDLDAPPEASLVPTSLVGVASDGRPLASLLQQAASAAALEAMVRTQIADAGRVAQGVATVARPRLDGHTRYLTGSSCSRCAILAGRFYRWSSGFLRHPRCDCVMVPTTQNAAPDLVSDPMEAFRSGQIRGLSKADAQAVKDGADLAQVVNVRRSEAGLQVAGRVFTRGARTTPEGIYAVASDRDQALTLLERFGYTR